MSALLWDFLTQSHWPGLYHLGQPNSSFKSHMEIYCFVNVKSWYFPIISVCIQFIKKHYKISYHRRLSMNEVFITNCLISVIIVLYWISVTTLALILSDSIEIIFVLVLSVSYEYKLSYLEKMLGNHEIHRIVWLFMNLMAHKYISIKILSWELMR